MTSRNRIRFVVALLITALITIVGVTPARATTVTYNIDQAQSSLLISGDLTGNPASQQTSNSLSTSYTGTIVADLQPGKIAFPGGSAIDAALQPVNQQPRADATPGSAPADYGRTAPGPFSSTALEALRNFVLDIEDDTFGAGITLSGNNFASNSLIIDIAGGDSDVLYGSTPAEVSLSGKGTANGSGGGASSVVQSGGIETLTLKISSGSIGYSIAQSSDSSISFSGTIVATRAVPEPATVATLALLAAMPLSRRRQRCAAGC